MGQESRITNGSHPAGFAEAHQSFANAAPVTAPPVPQSPVLAAPVLATPILAEGSRFRVRTLTLLPGQSTSLQSHLHRAEHWIIVEGTAEITLGRRARLFGEGEAIHIPLGEPHRLENPGRLPVTLIAVETGCYLGEDDVIRHE